MGFIPDSERHFFLLQNVIFWEALITLFSG